MLRTLFGRSFVLFLGDSASRALLMLTGILLARRLGPGAFGILAFAQALLGYVQLLGDGGLSTAGTRAVAAEVGKARAAWYALASIRTLLVGVWLALAAAILAALHTDSIARGTILLTLAAALPAMLLPDWVMRATGRISEAAVLALLPALLALPPIVLWVRGPEQLLLAPGFRLLAAVATLALAFAMVGAHPFAVGSRQTAGDWWRARWRSGFAQAGGALLVTNVAVLAITSADTLLLKIFAGDAMTGLYGAAYRLVQMPMLALYSVTAVALPMFVRALGPAREPIPLRRLTWLATGIGVAISAALCVSRRPLLHLLYGSAFDAASRPLGILAWIIPLDFLVSIRGTAYIAAGLERPAAICSTVAALANVLTNLWIVPRFGMTGAACTTLATYALLAALYGTVLEPRLSARRMHGIPAPDL